MGGGGRRRDRDFEAQTEFCALGFLTQRGGERMRDGDLVLL